MEDDHLNTQYLVSQYNTVQLFDVLLVTAAASRHSEAEPLPAHDALRNLHRYALDLVHHTLRSHFPHLHTQKRGGHRFQII